MSSNDNSPPDLVFGDAGGWISGPSLDAGRLGGPRFGSNVALWMAAYPDYILQGGFEGFGFVAWRRRSRSGRKSGEPIKALTLDGLAELVDHREVRADEPAGG